MLSRALQKANMAVNMDNDKEFSGARPLYVEACELLQQILQRTTAQGDKEKLEAIMPASAGSTTPQIALAAQSADERSYHPRQPGEPAETQLSLNGMSYETHRGPEHSREDSQHSWLDPIDESGGSTGSSVHSRTSSLGYRRRQIRPASGGTEAEFDNALDEAIEAAYNDGYEPAAVPPPEQQEAHDEVVANALRKVELARERVRQTGREAYELASERERERFQLQPQRPDYADRRDPSEGQFFDDSSDEEERILDEFTRDYGLHQEPLSRRQQPAMSSMPRESGSSGFTARTWQSSIGSNPPGTGATTLSTVTESISEKALPIPPTSTTPPPPLAPPPTQALPEIPQQSLQTSTQTVRNRRMSGQAHRQLKIETMKLTPSPPPPALEQKSPYPDTSPPSGRESSRPLEGNTRPPAIPHRTSSPSVGPSPLDTRPLDSPFAPRAAQDPDDADTGRSTSPSISKLKKNFSSSSLRSLKGRNMSVSHLDEWSEMSPGTPTSSHWTNSQTPMMPSIPPAVAVNLQKFDASMPIFDDNFHFPDDPGATDLNDPEAPISLEPCPTDFLLRPFWLMRVLFQTLVHPRGGYVSSKLFVPREAWKVKNVKLKNVEDKIANCDLLTAALLKLARVDTCDADAMLEEMQAIENILEQVQASLVRKLGNEVGVSNASAMFKEATVPPDGDMAMSRSASVSDQIARQVEDPGLKHADKTQVGLELYVERERGITVKAQTCTMLYKHKGQDYLIHLVDTPGHVDFRAEVTRSYASCGGALLLVDASQGIQAQTASNFHLAFAQDLALVPVINKIDMPSADVPRVLKQIESNFELDPSQAVLVSAKTGKGVDSILPAVVERIPHPVGDEKKPLKMLLVDSWYDNFKGVVLLVRIFDGVVKAGDHVVSLGTGMKYAVGQVGIQYPNATPQGVLRAGQVGYVFFNPGMKKIQDAKLGDTFTTVQDQLTVEPYPGFEEPQPMVFVAAFPTDQSDYTRIADSISQLVLNDRSVTLQKAFSEALGSGWRLGFLGSLHCSVFQDRLKGEHGGDVIVVYDLPASQLVDDFFGKLKGATKGYATLEYEDWFTLRKQTA
ncbi:GTP-binding protein GUF1 [Emericellopsis cladophorae]|uniref:GTP-binding protein GUF1 n=1 Tax=Emericellopsis cladophorae TaxID=2686198 RepID=A0A9P9Y4C1_9HYPO|nr:GTP-binding protein GUF1 [Emericellopsis cladophorae]KAI6782699.1 GTP-binding protein GUF1 [Emericellopsis cladophorae]